MEIIELRGDTGTAEAEGVKREVNLQFLKDAKIGDFVIIHAGFAIEKIDKKRAQETLNLFKEMRS